MEAPKFSESAPLSRSEILLAVTIAIGALAILFWLRPSGLDNDPDSYMHLARFREGYGIFHGGFVPRDNAPYGTVLPWTMPMDGALAIFYAIGRAFTDPSRALYFAARVVSPFFCVTTGLLIFFGLRPFFSLRARAVMAGLAATSPQLIDYSRPGEADHHAMALWFSVLFAVALIRYLFVDQPRYWQAAAAGIAASGATWTSLEGFVVIAAGLSALVVHRCMVERPRLSGARTNDLVFGGAFAVALTTAWLVDPPYEGLWALKVDRLSVVYVSFAWLFAATLAGFGVYVSKAAAFSRPRNLAVAALLGGAAFLCWIAIEPDIVKGPFGQVDPALFAIWFDDIGEMQPMWRLNGWTAAHLVCLILIWIAIALVIAKSSGPRRWLWTAYAVLMIPVSLIGIRYIRAIYYAEVFGSIPLGLVLANFSRRFSTYVGGVAVAASTPALFSMAVVTEFLWVQATPSYEKRDITALCGPESLSPAIAPILNTDAIIMTELDAAWAVLYLSPQLRTVAGPNHRNTQGISDHFAFFNAHSGEDARAILDKRGVKYVLICDTGKERADLFGDRILHNTPAWLQPIGSSAPPPAFRLYRLRSRDE
jgi:asparagine N-glycosylation enzyme membrane subunit Stt3